MFLGIDCEASFRDLLRYVSSRALNQCGKPLLQSNHSRPCFLIFVYHHLQQASEAAAVSQPVYLRSCTFNINRELFVVVEVPERLKACNMKQQHSKREDVALGRYVWVEVGP